MIEPDADPFTNFWWDWRASGRLPGGALDGKNSYIHQSSGYDYKLRNGTTGPSNYGTTFDYLDDQSIAESININGGTYWTGVNYDPLTDTVSATHPLADVTGWRNASQPSSGDSVFSLVPDSTLISYDPIHENTGGFQ